MFSVTVETTFSAGHQLTFGDGSTEPLHEHDWVVRVCVGTEELGSEGFVIDFVWLQEQLERITGEFAGRKLEDVPYFKEAGINASAENVAKYIFDKIRPLLGHGADVEYVEVQEATGCWAKYSPWGQ